MLVSMAEVGVVFWGKGNGGAEICECTKPH
jgi:hypothetical protein